MTIIIHIIRFVIAAIVLLVVSYLVPGFDLHGFTKALLTALIISALGWIAEVFLGGVSPYSRGLIGFLSSAMIIYVTKYIIPSVHITIIGALLASLLIGIIDLFLPANVRFKIPKE